MHRATAQKLLEENGGIACLAVAKAAVLREVQPELEREIVLVPERRTEHVP